MLLLLPVQILPALLELLEEIGSGQKNDKNR